MVRYDIFYYESLGDKLHTRDLIIHSDNIPDLIKEVIIKRLPNESGIRIDTREKKNLIVISLKYKME